MTAKQDLDLLRQVYRLEVRDPAAFAHNPASDFSAKAKACHALNVCAAGLHRWAERQCNGIPRYDSKAKMIIPSWTEADSAAQDKAQSKLEAKALAALSVIFAAVPPVEFQRDPRGAMIKVYRPGSESSGNPDLWV